MTEKLAMQAPRASQAAPKAEDFPALGGLRPSSSSSSAAGEAFSSGQGATAGQAGVSEALKAANKVSAVVLSDLPRPTAELAVLFSNAG